MSTNENLEVKINEITNSIKGLSERATISSADMNYLVDKVTSKVEEANEDALVKLTGDISESVLDILNKKHSEVKEKLDLIEVFIEEVQKNTKNNKLENDVTRILNDIEALHSKMNSQEMQTENISKTLEIIKNSSSAGQISQLCDEIVEISKSYDGIAEILNKNFQEFLRKVETTSSREEFQRLRYNLENIEGNQNVLVSAMNAINEKQDEIKNLFKQSSISQNADKFEQLQNALNQINMLILETTSKSDMEILSDRISAVSLSISDFKRAFDESKDENGIKTVINGQLNNIIAQLEGLKMNSNSNVGEDIIRLYTSIAEFKDSIYSSINTQLNDVVASMDVQFNKISNAVISATSDAGITVNNLSGDIQKLNSIMVDGLNTKAYEIRQDIEKHANDSAMSAVNSIKELISELSSGIEGLNNSDGINELLNSIESLKHGFDFNSLILQIDQIKSALDFTPIKEQLEALNKDETITSINEKADTILGYVRNSGLSEKLDELQKTLKFEDIYSALNSITEKIDLSPLEEKIALIKNEVSNIDITEDIKSIRENVEKIEEIKAELNSVNKIEEINYDVKNKVEEILRLNVQKIEEDKELSQSIKDALKVIHEMLSEIISDNTRIELLNEVKENQNINSSKLFELISESNLARETYANLLNEKIENSELSVKENLNETKANIENSLSVISDKVSAVDDKLANKNDETIDEIKNELLSLAEFVKNVHSNPISDQINDLKEKLSGLNKDNLSEIEENISEFQKNLALNLNIMKSSLDESLKKAGLEEILNPFFEDIKISLTDRIDFVETTIGKSNELNIEQLNTTLKAALNSLQQRLEASYSKVVEEKITTKVDIISTLLNNQAKETTLEVVNYLKQETEILTSIFDENIEKSKNDAINKIARIIDAKENSEERITFVKDVSNGVREILENTNVIKMGLESNSDFANELADKIDVFENNITETIKNLDETNINLLNNIENEIEAFKSNVTESIKGLNETLNQTNIKDDFTKDSLEIKKLIGKVNHSVASVGAFVEGTLPTNEKFNELSNGLILSIKNIKENLAEIKEELNSNKEQIKEQIKEETEEIKSVIENSAAHAESDGNSILSFGTIIEQKMNDKISILESLIDDSIDKIDKKTDVILNSGQETYKEFLNEKFKDAVAELKEEYESKLTGIHKAIDEKVFEIVSKNNEIIKDELKYRTDALSRNFTKLVKDSLNSMSNANKEDENDQASYTIKELEGDLAKIRLAVEKNAKLSNFKEFASRLIELKNINLENAKISRAMGSDIMKFDGWLKNTTAKIELLAAKIEKSEKIKMEDLKSRLMQSEKNQAMPQKLEEAVMSIYKKYRSQETKIDELMNKIEDLSRKETDTFDAKEFIDLFYDNNKKQQNLVSRMNSLEDKMDLIQGKIDHIIEACIDTD